MTGPTKRAPSHSTVGGETDCAKKRAESTMERTIELQWIGAIQHNRERPRSMTTLQEVA
eukprot:CAMPEP_0184685640 /NCGR_PEP_ID=MMETSP0312-20130426/19628_1 /TAXON_ID=31354 /ORGANISM="Compsopogon coeruleus, Strain SAG 36.94" /LENGTH=58 /DNA_ID=CAMNT_0027139913 /DNA_START=429 /DNA_END=605 /DNA_ORIENTATION=+